MKCKAKITDHYGGKYSCCNDATDKLTITTFAPHLNRNVITVKHLCKKHLHRTKANYNYKIKHCGKKTTLKEESIIN